MNINDIVNNEGLNNEVEKSIKAMYYKYKMLHVIELDDFAQECYINIMSRVKNFDESKTNIESYLKIIIASTMKEVLRQAHGRAEGKDKMSLTYEGKSLDSNLNSKQSGGSEMLFSTVIEDEKSSFENAVLNTLTISEILRMNSLSEKEKEVIKLFSEGYTLTELSRKLDINTTTAHNRFLRAKDKIRGYFNISVII